MSTDRELAFFGGWTRRTVAGGDLPWGDPRNRVQARRWDEKAGLQARYLSVPINNELYWLNGGQP